MVEWHIHSIFVIYNDIFQLCAEYNLQLFQWRSIKLFPTWNVDSNIDVMVQNRHTV